VEDQQIVALYFERVEDAILETKNKYGKILVGISYGILRLMEDAKECENDTYLKTWNSIPPMRPKMFLSFLAKVIRNISLDHYDYLHAKKRGEGEIPVLLDELAECLAMKETTLDETGLTEVIDQFLGALRPEARIIFMRRYWFGDSIQEIAKKMNCGESKVKMTLSRLRLQLKGVLERGLLYMRKNVEKLLYVMTDVKDKYVVEAMDIEGKEKDLNRKWKARHIVYSFVVAAACLCVVLGVREGTRVKKQGDGENVMVANPFQDVQTIEQAEKIVGFNIAVPEKILSYTISNISVISETLIDVSYQNENSEKIYEIRKGRGENDISGDYTEYKEKVEREILGKKVKLSGENGKYNLVTWTDRGYTYSISTPIQAMTMQEIEKLIAQVQ